MAEDKFTEKLSLWLDDELEEAEVAQLHAHLQQCAACQKTYSEMQHLDQWLRGVATVMVSPSAEFKQRVEAGLAQVQPQQTWQLWLAMLALAVGAVLIFGVWGLASGVTLYGIGLTLLDVRLVNEGLLAIISTADNFRLYLVISGLFLKTGLITMQQPLFWGLVIVAAAAALFWIRLLRRLVERGVNTVGLMI